MAPSLLSTDSLAYRTIGIYVFLRTVMCSPDRASQIAHALKLPRVSVVRRLEELIKHGYVERASATRIGLGTRSTSPIYSRNCNDE
jgi:DNA-binding IclR family transcriptional regulator